MMLEYLNYGAMGLLGVFFIILIVTDIVSKRKGKGFYIMLFAMTALLFLDANNKNNSARSNIAAFKNTHIPLKCYSGGGLYSAGHTYKVSRDEGWSLSKNYFSKDSLAIKADKCESW